MSSLDQLWEELKHADIAGKIEDIDRIISEALAVIGDVIDQIPELLSWLIKYLDQPEPALNEPEENSDSNFPESKALPAYSHPKHLVLWYTSGFQ